MKKTQKALVLTLCGALCALLVTCASSGGAPSDGFGEGVPYVGEWAVFNDENDNGNSTVQMTVTEKNGMPAYTITGNVTTKFIYGFVGWMITPDAATLENLKNAKAISFRYVGDGKRQTVKYRIGTVQDYAHFEFHFAGEPGVEDRVEVPVRFFQQPSWGVPVRLNQQRAEDISWQTHESWRPGSFEITIWDVRIHL
jgi:hypothetical protein